MKKRAFLVTLIIVACSTFIFAQSDYVVTSKGDTLRGEVRILTYDLLDRVQLVAGKKNKTTYTAVQVRAISVNNEVYIPQRYTNSIRFMKLVKSGYVSLYLFRPANQMTYDGRYLVKMDGQSLEVPNIGFKKLISNYIEDCPEVYTKVKNEQLKRGDLDKIIDEYNTCIATKSKTPQPVPAVVATETVPAPALISDKTEAIKNLQTKVVSLENMADKKDVLDLLTDIADKAAKEKAIPNYQLEALKGYLSSNEAVSAELEKVITLLKGN
ncbi:MAG: hypothetical protein DI538_18920 [Azospira oryzae]|jgi:hypothetical protein|nr:MAG: hypothetical protein DI538_18920 [Azospira oryzae]